MARASTITAAAASVAAWNRACASATGEPGSVRSALMPGARGASREELGVASPSRRSASSALAVAATTASCNEVIAS